MYMFDSLTVHTGPNIVLCVTLFLSLSPSHSFLSSVVDTPVIIQTIQCPEHFMTQAANGVVQRLQMLLLLMTFQGQLGAQHLATDVTAMASAHWRRESGGGSPCRPGTHNTILGPLVVKQSVSFISYVPFNPYQAISTIF